MCIFTSAFDGLDMVNGMIKCGMLYMTTILTCNRLFATLLVSDPK